MATRTIYLRFKLPPHIKDKASEAARKAKALFDTHNLLNRMIERIESSLLCLRQREVYTRDKEKLFQVLNKGRELTPEQQGMVENAVDPIPAYLFKDMALKIARTAQMENHGSHVGSDEEVLANLRFLYESLVPSSKDAENASPSLGDAGQVSSSFYNMLFKSEKHKAPFEQTRSKLIPRETLFSFLEETAEKTESGANGTEQKNIRYGDTYYKVRDTTTVIRFINDNYDEEKGIFYNSGEFGKSKWFKKYKRFRSNEIQDTEWVRDFFEEQIKFLTDIRLNIRERLYDLYHLLPLLDNPLPAQINATWRRVALRRAVEHMLSWESWNKNTRDEYENIQNKLSLSEKKLSDTETAFFGTQKIKIDDTQSLFLQYEAERDVELEAIGAFTNEATHYRMNGKSIEHLKEILQKWEGYTSIEDREGVISKIHSRKRKNMGDHHFYHWLVERKFHCASEKINDFVEYAEAHVENNEHLRELDRKNLYANYTSADSTAHPRWVLYESEFGSGNVHKYKLRNIDDHMAVRLRLLTGQGEYSEEEHEFELYSSRQFQNPVIDSITDKGRLGFATNYESYTGKLGGAELFFDREQLVASKKNDSLPYRLGRVLFKLVVSVDEKIPKEFLDAEGERIHEVKKIKTHFISALDKATTKHQKHVKPGFRVFSLDLGIRSFAYGIVYELKKKSEIDASSDRCYATDLDYEGESLAAVCEREAVIANLQEQSYAHAEHESPILVYHRAHQNLMRDLNRLIESAINFLGAVSALLMALSNTGKKLGQKPFAQFERTCSSLFRTLKRFSHTEQGPFTEELTDLKKELNSRFSSERRSLYEMVSDLYVLSALKDHPDDIENLYQEVRKRIRNNLVVAQRKAQAKELARLYTDFVENSVKCDTQAHEEQNNAQQCIEWMCALIRAERKKDNNKELLIPQDPERNHIRYFYAFQLCEHIIARVVSQWRRYTRPRYNPKSFDYRRDYRGRKSLWTLEYLGAVKKLLLRWNGHRPLYLDESGRLFSIEKRQNRERWGSYAKRLQNHINAVKDDYITSNANAIIRAARGYVPNSLILAERSETRKSPWGVTNTYPPCHLIVFEDLSRYRFKNDRPPSENRQLMKWAHREIVKTVAEQAEIHGIEVYDELSAEFSSRYDAKAGSPGLRAKKLSKKDAESIKTERERALGLQPDDNLTEDSAEKHAVPLLDILEKDFGIGSNSEFVTILQEGAIIPWYGGAYFVTRIDSDKVHGTSEDMYINADFNAAHNLQRRFWTRYHDAFRARLTFAKKDGDTIYYKLKNPGVRIRGAIMQLGETYRKSQGYVFFSSKKDVKELPYYTMHPVRKKDYDQAIDTGDLGTLKKEAQFSQEITVFRDPSGRVYNAERWYEPQYFWGTVLFQKLKQSFMDINKRVLEEKKQTLKDSDLPI